MKTIDYLDALKERYQVSDYKVARLLGKTSASTSQYRKKGTTFDDATAIRVAELLNMDPVEVIADMHAERAKDDQVREVWKRVASTFHRAAAICLVVVILSVSFGGNKAVEAATLSPQQIVSTSADAATMYIMLSLMAEFLADRRRRSSRLA